MTFVMQGRVLQRLEILRLRVWIVRVAQYVRELEEARMKEGGSGGCVYGGYGPTARRPQISRFSSMSSLHILLDATLAEPTGGRKRHELVQAIEIALDEVDAACSTVNRISVDPGMHLTPKLASHPESPDTLVVALAKNVVEGRQPLHSLDETDLLLLQRALRLRKNSLSNISHLPDELLIGILDHCPSIEPDGPDFETAHFLCYVRISHVCHRWREIVLERPQFWSHITCPLTVGLNIGASAANAVAVQKEVLAQLPRVRELRIQRDRYGRDLPSLILVPAPMLETFHIAPMLKHLTLTYCMLKINSPLWRKLVSLDLINAWPNLDMHKFISFIQTEIPSIVSLSLVFPAHIFPDTTYVHVQVEPVTLELEEIKLAGSIWQCYYFLEATQLPSVQRIVVQMAYASGDLEAGLIWGTLEQQRAISADPEDAVICAIHVSDVHLNAAGQYGLDFQIYTLATRSIAPRFSVHFVTEKPQETWTETVLARMMTILTTDRATTLSMSCDLDFSKTRLHLHPSIHSVTFRNSTSPLFALENDPLFSVASHFDAVHAEVYFPVLRRLAFTDVDFTGEKEMGILLDWLAQRKHRGLGVEELRFSRCVFAGGYWPEGPLKELVEQVYID
ncbi:hypothetical protein C8F01DRAFT_1370765 [Mycena amicta]|nr:hypothetical protein C8F01DRAFT_1370765 [Mycena amicta]